MTAAAVMPTYGRYDIAFDRGEGPYLIATDGRRFLDFAAGIADRYAFRAQLHHVAFLQIHHVARALKNCAGIRGEKIFVLAFLA
mgnify:CR=1 FL=1